MAQALLSSLLAQSPGFALSGVPAWLGGFQISGDLSPVAQWGVLGLFLATLVLLVLESRTHPEHRRWVLLTGGLAASLLSLAVLRPSWIHVEGREVPGLVVVLVDDSHRLELPGDEDLTRKQEGQAVVDALKSKFAKSRIEVRPFGDRLRTIGEGTTGDPHTSDLLTALSEVSSGGTELPRSLVLVSDGRLTRPGPKAGDDWVQQLNAASGGIPVDTVRLSESAPRDRSIRSVGITGSAIAHQPFNLALTVGCEPVEDCSSVEVVVRELLEGQGPVELVRGTATGSEGIARLDLQVTLERAGGRVIEIELLSDEPDVIVENDRRIFPVQVRRDRLRFLHVAGRPTYDVRALRMFLKSDESIDLVSFFILRTLEDQVEASPDEMALIPFPVDELFSEHLASFDAVILQDINAHQYQLDRHFQSLSSYVLKGGGLIMVGGPAGFSAGGYAGSRVEEVLPVHLPRGGKTISEKAFAPNYTRSGLAAPMLAGLRASMGGELPQMSGTNLLGRPRPGALVLWEHPTLQQDAQSGGDPMPVLALHEVGDGRSIAISVDGTHQLRFGDAGAQTGGRAYAELWGGLLGWLMRDPRFEGAQIRPLGECLAGRDFLISVTTLAGSDEELQVTLERLGQKTSEARALKEAGLGQDGARLFLARDMSEGGYAVRVQVGSAPPTRTVFSCEIGGESWSDSRPDAGRMRDLAESTGGVTVRFNELDQLTEPRSTFVAAKKQSQALFPPWVWATLASIGLCGHWVLRRAVGIV